MKVILKSGLDEFVEKQVKSGRYRTPGDVIAAGLARLMQEDADFDFAPGELKALVDEGEADIARGDVVTLEQARAHFVPRRSRGRRKKAPTAS